MKKDALLHLRDSYEYLVFTTEKVGGDLGGMTLCDMSENSFAWMLKIFLEENPMFIEGALWAVIEADEEIS